MRPPRRITSPSAVSMPGFPGWRNTVEAFCVTQRMVSPESSVRAAYPPATSIMVKSRPPCTIPYGLRWFSPVRHATVQWPPRRSVISRPQRSLKGQFSEKSGAEVSVSFFITGSLKLFSMQGLYSERRGMKRGELRRRKADGIMPEKRGECHGKKRCGREPFRRCAGGELCKA